MRSKLDLKPEATTRSFSFLLPWPHDLSHHSLRVQAAEREYELPLRGFQEMKRVTLLHPSDIDEARYKVSRTQMSLARSTVEGRRH